MNEPTQGQLALLVLSVALFAASIGLSLARIWWDRNALRIAAKGAQVVYAPAPVVRDTAVKTLRVFAEILAANRKEKIFLSIVSKLIECRAGVPPRGENLQAASVPCRHGLG